MEIEKLLKQYKEGGLTDRQMLEAVRLFSYEDLGYAKVDHHRALRNGMPEVVYCPGKQDQQIVGIVSAMVARGGKNIILSRSEAETAASVQRAFPESVYYEDARMLVVNPQAFEKKNGSVCVVSAGTADLPVAKEAYITLKTLGNRVFEVYDVGVAGIHRLLSKQETIGKADVIIVVAGMEGALASVVGGLFDKPVIAVPTSVGYGSGTGGRAALLSMLNSCASGMSVVNIDNGFGAACMANRIINLLNREEEDSRA